MKMMFRFLGIAILILAVATGCEKQDASGPDGPQGPDGDPKPAAAILLTVDDSNLVADGMSQTRITAELIDADGAHVVDGTAVSFNIISGDGELFGAETVTVDGFAEVIYIAGTTPGAVVFGAESGHAGSTLSIALIPVGGDVLELMAESGEVLADGEASTRIIAVLRDEFGDPVTPGTTVSFESTLGEIEDVLPTDSLGTASARLRSTRYLTGTARVTAAAEGLTATIDIEFVSGAAAHIEVLSVDPQEIGVLGTSQVEVSTLTFVVRDADGIPVDAGHAVTLEFRVHPLDADTDATIHPASAATNEFGRVLATVNAGVISGAVEVEATSGAMSASSIPIVINGGLPDPARLTIGFEKLNVAGLLFNGITNLVTAYLADKHGNPVPEGTMVWFRTDNGIVDGAAATDDLGRASVLAITANPRPGPDGLVPVCAKSIPAPEFVEDFGDTIEVCGNIMWSGATQIEFLFPPVLDVPNGGSALVRFRVSDGNLNPLTAGTNISVTTSDGEIVGETGVTLPDTQSDAYTTFEVYVTDDNAAEELPREIWVTVDVTSINGNASASIQGTMR